MVFSNIEQEPDVDKKQMTLKTIEERLQDAKYTAFTKTVVQHSSWERVASFARSVVQEMGSSSGYMKRACSLLHILADTTNRDRPVDELAMFHFDIKGWPMAIKSCGPEDQSGQKFVEFVKHHNDTMGTVVNCITHEVGQ